MKKNCLNILLAAVLLVLLCLFAVCVLAEGETTESYRPVQIVIARLPKAMYYGKNDAFTVRITDGSPDRSGEYKIEYYVDGQWQEAEYGHLAPIQSNRLSASISTILEATKLRLWVRVTDNITGEVTECCSDEVPSLGLVFQMPVTDIQLLTNQYAQLQLESEGSWKVTSSRKKICDARHYGTASSISLETEKAGKSKLTIIAEDGTRTVVNVTVTEGPAYFGVMGDLSWALDKKKNLVFTGTGPIPDLSATPMKAWLSHPNDIRTISIPDGVTSIGSGAFASCAKVTAANIPLTVTEIGENVFPENVKATFTVIAGTKGQAWAAENNYKVKLITRAESVELSQAEGIINVGKALALKATVSPKETTNKKVAWTSSDETVATVKAGKVQAKGVGSCVITCTTEDGTELSASCNITVIKMVTAITPKAKKLTVELGTTVEPEFTVKPEDATHPEITWTSSDESVIKVTDKGAFEAVGAGTCTLTAAATDGSGKTAKITVTVPKPAE